MITIEIVLLILTYTILVVGLFVQIICYKRNLENLETIYLTGTLILLILSLTLNHILNREGFIDFFNVLVLLAMVLVACATPICILQERIHKLPKCLTNYILYLSLVVIIMIFLSYLVPILTHVEFLVAGFLVASIISSMIFIRFTKPKISIPFREKVDRLMAIAFMVVVPISVFAEYISDKYGLKLQLGFTLPFVLIILAVTKLIDDLKRTSLFISNNSLQEDCAISFGLTKREKEVAELLLKGKTYIQISESLFISLPTVKTHVSNIYKKCKVKNKVELMALLMY